MSIVNNLLKLFVGDKTKKDLKSILPLVEATKSHETAFNQLSNDELRDKTVQFKSKIKAVRAQFDQEIEDHKKAIESLEDIDERERLYNRIDALENEALGVTEEILLALLPRSICRSKRNGKTICSKY